MKSEPKITINGVALSVGQAMALRVAANQFYLEMHARDPLGSDERGRRIAEGYRDRLIEVLRLMVRSEPPDVEPSERRGANDA